MPPKVSVITLCFGDRAEYLKPRIDSILGQTYKDFEWIIVDDGTPPRTKALLNSLAGNPHVKMIIQHPEPHTISESYNEAISYCTGDFILRAEDDDTADHTLIEKFADIFERFPRVGIVYCAARTIDEKGIDTGMVGSRKSPQKRKLLQHDWVRPGVEVFLEMVKDGGYVFGCSQMIRRACILKLGGYSTDLALSADADLVYRIALSYDIAFLAEPLVGYRRHPASYTHRKPSPRRIHEYYAVYEKALGYAQDSGLALETKWKAEALALRGRLVLQSLKECLRMYDLLQGIRLLAAAKTHDPDLAMNLVRGMRLWLDRRANRNKAITA